MFYKDENKDDEKQKEEEETAPDVSEKKATKDISDVLNDIWENKQVSDDDKILVCLSSKC